VHGSTGRFLEMHFKLNVLLARATSCVVTREYVFFTNREMILANLNHRFYLYSFNGLILSFVFLKRTLLSRLF